MTLITSKWSECPMKKDAEVLRYMRERRKGTNQELAAARAGMSVKTARPRMSEPAGCSAS